MLSVNSMLNQDYNTTAKEMPTTSFTPIRPTALTISHLLCEPSMKTPSLSPSSSPSPTNNLTYPFNEKPMTPSLSHSTQTNFALQSRPFLPTLHFIEDKKRRSPSLPYPGGNSLSTTSLSSSLDFEQDNDEKESDELDDDDDDDDDDQLSLHSKVSSSTATLASTSAPSESLKAKRKRANTKQLETLNQVFERTFFPSTQMRIELGKKLAMSPRTVQIWFQNKRQSMRTKERQRLPKLKNGSVS